MFNRFSCCFRPIAITCATNPGIEEIYTLAAAANKNGQKIIRVHSFPFPMSAENLRTASSRPHYEFWQNLKQGWDWFKANGAPLNVEVRNGHYVFEILNPANPQNQ